MDFGFYYITQAQLSKATDASALMGVRNLYRGDADVATIVQATFAMNYGTPGRDTGPVTPSVTFVTDPNSGSRRLQVSARTTIRTYFLRVIPGFETLSVGASAEALRGKLIMSVILDRSGSMALNGGCSSLPPAVDTFIDFFDDTVDQVALVTFATTVRVDLAMGHPFKSQVKAAVPQSCSSSTWWVGATFAHGGLNAGYSQIRNTPVAPGDNPIKIAVFFTDGLANLIQEKAYCPPTQTLMYGGIDSGSIYAVMPLDSDTTVLSYETGSPPSYCPGFTSFISVTGGTKTVTADNLRAEGRARAINTAQLMQNNGIVVYAVGFGSNVDGAFLQQVANDKASLYYSASRPAGRALIAPTTQDLTDVFRTIASEILARLTR